MFCFFAGIIVVLRYSEVAYCLVLHVLGLRKLPSANHCSSRPPSRELGAEGVIGALDLLLTYCCLLEYDYWTQYCRVGKFSMSIRIECSRQTVASASPHRCILIKRKENCYCHVLIFGLQAVGTWATGWDLPHSIRNLPTTQNPKPRVSRTLQASFAFCRMSRPQIGKCLLVTHDFCRAVLSFRSASMRN